MVIFASIFGPEQVYVSANGKDSNSGRSWGSAFATLQKAIDSSSGASTIHVRGSIRVATTVTIQNANGLKVVGEKGARLIGSQKVNGWKPDHLNGIDVFSAKWSGPSAPYELFVGTKRAERARLPETGFYQFPKVEGLTAQYNEGQDRAEYDPAKVPALSHPEDAEAVVHQLWITSRLPIARVDAATHTFVFAKKSVFQMKPAGSDQPANYCLENVAEGLKSPGQWCWSSSQSTIYYVPRPGEKPGDLVAEVPVVPTVLTVNHSANVVIENIKFEGSEFRYPATQAGDGQAATSVPAAVELADSQNCVFQNDTVSNSGTYGFEVTGASRGNRFERCTVEDVGAGGIKVGHGTASTTVENCTLRHLGKTYASAIGIWIGNSGHNRVGHNLIEDSGYSGISVGWTWGYGKSDAVDNLIESNLIRDLGYGELSDMGGIYTLGVSPGTILRHNRIDHVRCTYYGGWGIYLDEGTSNVLVEDNLVTDCQTGNFHQHYGANNLIRNNIFAFAPTIAQVVRTRPEDHVSFTMQGNIFDWNGPPLLGGNLAAGIVFQNNLLWEAGKKIDLPPFASNNSTGDPLFKNAAKGDFSLPSNSPALSIGFKPFDLKGFGPQGR